MKYQRLGCVGRFKPLHLGGSAMLDAVCDNAEHAIIGIGSTNKYNIRNPFTADETEAMLHAYLKARHDKYEIIRIPDYGDGPKWREHAKKDFGNLDFFVSSNDYVRDLLTGHYPLLHSVELIPTHRHIPLCASQVRLAMAQNNPQWREMVPQEISQYIDQHGLLNRFQKEYGLATLALAIDPNAENMLSGNETAEEQRLHTMEASAIPIE